MKKIVHYVMIGCAALIAAYQVYELFLHSRKEQAKINDSTAKAREAKAKKRERLMREIEEEDKAEMMAKAKKQIDDDWADESLDIYNQEENEILNSTKHKENGSEEKRNMENLA